MTKKLEDLRVYLRRLFLKRLDLEASRREMVGEANQYAVELRVWCTWVAAALEAEARARELVVAGFAGETTRQDRENNYQIWRFHLLYVAQAERRIGSVHKRYKKLLDRVEHVDTLLEGTRESIEAVEEKVEGLIERIIDEEERVDQRVRLLALGELEQRLEEFVSERWFEDI